MPGGMRPVHASDVLVFVSSLPNSVLNFAAWIVSHWKIVGSEFQGRGVELISGDLIVQVRRTRRGILQLDGFAVRLAAGGCDGAEVARERGRRRDQAADGRRPHKI